MNALDWLAQAFAVNPAAPRGAVPPPVLDPSATLEAPPPAPALPSTPTLELAPEPVPVGGLAAAEAAGAEALGLNAPPPMIARPGEVPAPDPEAPPAALATPSPAPPAPAPPSPSPSPASAFPATAGALSRRGRGAPGGSPMGGNLEPPGSTPARPTLAPPGRPYAAMSAAELERQRIRAETDPVLEAQSNDLIDERLRAQDLNDRLRAQTLARDRARQSADAVAREPLRPERYVDDMSFGDTVGAVIAAVFAGLAGRPEVFHGLLNDRIKRDLAAQKERKTLLYQNAVARLGSEEAALAALEARSLNAAARITDAQAELGTLSAQQDGQLRAAGLVVEQQARAAQARAEQLAIEAHGKTQQALAEYGGKKAIDAAYARQTAAPVPEGDAGQLALLRRKYGVSDTEWSAYQGKAGPVRVADAELDDVERYIASIAPPDATGTAPGYIRGGHEVWSIFASNEGNALQQKIGSVVSSVLKSQPGPASDTDIALATRGIIADGSLPAIRRGLTALRTRNRRSLDAYAQQFPGAADAARDLSTLRTGRSASADPNREQWHPAAAGGR
jgi:hypothetical protein